MTNALHQRADDGFDADQSLASNFPRFGLINQIAADISLCAFSMHPNWSKASTYIGRPAYSTPVYATPNPYVAFGQWPASPPTPGSPEAADLLAYAQRIQRPCNRMEHACKQQCLQVLAKKEDEKHAWEEVCLLAMENAKHRSSDDTSKRSRRNARRNARRVASSATVTVCTSPVFFQIFLSHLVALIDYLRLAASARRGCACKDRAFPDAC